MTGPLAEIRSIVREVLRDSDIEMDAATCFDDLMGWDSMDLVTVVVEAECRFDIQFELAEIDRLATIGDLLQMIEAKRALTAA